MSDNKPALPTDNRKKEEYISKYPEDARRKQNCEAVYVFLLMVISFAILALNYIGCFKSWFYFKDEIATKMIYCLAAGLLGGATNDMKCLYKAVASQWWNEDRFLWRLFSPFIGVAFALILGSIFSGNFSSGNGFSAVTIGFFSGYFSDEAASKMYDVALTLFSKTKVYEKDYIKPKINEGDEN